MLTCPSCGKENPDGFQFCGFCTAPLTARPAPSLREERKVVTVLFCDLVGFTAASETADPEDVRSRIRPYHARLRQEIERYGGTVEKFIGDAVMAVFGAPITHEDDAERAVRAGLTILEGIAELNETDPGLSLRVRLGINTGEAVVALGARPEEGEGLVTGDVVNTASRLQGAAPVNGIAVSEQTYRETERIFDYEQLEPVAVKGKAQPLAIYQPLRARGRLGSDVTRTHKTPLVGRELERRLLIATFERAAQQRSVQLVTIVGEPGVGKSRLCAELLQYVAEGPALNRWRQGRCLPYGEGTAFWALGEIVKSDAGILESDSAEVAAAKLERAVSPDAPDRQWLLERLRPLVGVETASPAERQELFTAWRRFLETIAAACPTVLVFEDLHWADEALLTFLEYLIDWAEGVPLLVLCTARPELYEHRPTWGAGQRNAHTINLSRLSNDETATLVSHLIGRPLLNPELEEAIVARAEGNPLYAEEFVRLLSDRGLTPGEVALPHSVQALIAARLDTLPPERKSLIQDAAVLGTVFWAGGVAKMGRRDREDVELALHELARKELVRPAHVSSMAAESEYAFWHVLVRDVAYSQIPRAERARRHRAAATWLEGKAGERVEDLAEVLAHHYLQALELSEAAGETEQSEELKLPARRFLALAGERALQLNVGKAESYYRRALDLLPADAPERARLVAKAAEAAALAGRYPEAEASYTEAIAGLKASRDNLLAGEALVRLSIIVRDRGDTMRARELLDEAIHLLEQVPPGPELILAYTHLARYYHFTWPPEACFEWAEKAIATAEKLGIEERAMRARVFRGFTRVEIGDADGLDDLNEALRTGLELGVGEDTAGAYVGLGDIVWWTEGPAAGLEVYREGIEFTERRGMTYYTMYLKGESVWPLFDLGEWASLLQTAGEIFHWDRTSYQALLTLPYVAHVHFFRGDVAGADLLREEFLRRARQSADPQVLIPALAISGLIDSEVGNDQAARAAIEEIEQVTRNRPVRRAQHLPDALRVCAAAGAMDLAERLVESIEVTAARQRHAVLTARAVLTEARGQLEESLGQYEQAAARWTDYGFVLEHARALLGAGRCLNALGRRDEAAAPLKSAQAFFKSLDAKPLLAETEALLGESEAAVV